MTDSQGITAPDSPQGSLNAAVAVQAGTAEGKTSEYSSPEEGL